MWTGSGRSVLSWELICCRLPGEVPPTPCHCLHHSVLLTGRALGLPPLRCRCELSRSSPPWASGSSPAKWGIGSLTHHGLHVCPVWVGWGRLRVEARRGSSCEQPGAEWLRVCREVGQQVVKASGVCRLLSSRNTLSVTPVVVPTGQVQRMSPIWPPRLLAVGAWWAAVLVGLCGPSCEARESGCGWMRSRHGPSSCSLGSEAVARLASPLLAGTPEGTEVRWFGPPSPLGSEFGFGARAVLIHSGW